MKIVHLGSNDIGKTSIGGVATAVQGYARAQALLGSEVSIALTGNVDTPPNISVHSYRYWPVYGDKLQLSFSMWSDLRRLRSAVLHNHGLWRMPNVLPACVNKHKQHLKLVCSPHGVFSEWAMRNNGRQKQLMLKWLGQQSMLNYMDLFHATSEDEYEQIRRRGLKQPVMIVGNGVDVPEIGRIEKNYDTRKTLTFLGRIHPIKGLDFLLQSWLRVAAMRRDCVLKIAGPVDDAEYHRSLLDFINANHIANVEFVGAVNAEQKQDLFRNSDCLVLTSHSENFGMVVAEALAHAVPAITVAGVPWAGLNIQGCGWHVARESQCFDDCLKQVLDMPRELTQAMGMKGRLWVEEELSWRGVSSRLLQGYRWINGDGEKPGFIVR
jgi:glycosyltransferase involved in cell wall biosynthesis